MQKIDPAFLFELGDQLRKIGAVDQSSSFGYVYLTIHSTMPLIAQVVEGSIYSPLFRPPCRVAANALVACLNEISQGVSENGNWDATLSPFDAARIQSLYAKFETLLLAELQSSALYLVSPKGAYDTTTLIETGSQAFPVDLQDKVPNAIPDIKQATRCIAFELPTAAGFHLHRAHEAVLRVYWDNVTGGERRPKQNNMGDYLGQLEKLDKGKKAVRSHLQSIKDFHRNPLMHPDQSLENVDQALDLLAAIRSSIGYMLQEIPAQSVAPLIEIAQGTVPSALPNTGAGDGA